MKKEYSEVKKMLSVGCWALDATRNESFAREF